MKNRGKNSKKKRSDLSTIILLLIIVVVGMSIAYAALSATLTVQVNKITQNAITWDVGFKSGTVPVVEGGTGSTGRSCGAATVVDSSTVTVADTLLSKPDDSCTYTLTIENNGGIDAKLGTITANQPSSTTCTTSGASMVCGNITYKLATDASGSPLLALNSVINKKSGSTPGQQTVYLIVKYTGENASGSNVVLSNGGFTLVYNQA